MQPDRHPLALAIVITLLGSCHPLLAGDDPIPDFAYSQWVREPFVIGSPEENDVRAITTDHNGIAWVATRAGLRRIDNGKFVAVGDDIIGGPTYSIATSADGTLWVGGWNGVYRVTPKEIKQVGHLPGPILSFAFDNDLVVAGSVHGLFSRDGDDWRRWPSERIRTPTSLRGLTFMDDKLLAATDVGFTVIHAKGSTSYLPEQDEFSRVAQGVAIVPEPFRRPDEGPSIWVATNAGVDIRSLNDEQVRRLSMPRRGTTGVESTERDHLLGEYPCRDIRAIAFKSKAERPTAWLGTNEGLIMLTHWSGGWPGTYRFLHSRRWLPSNEVRAIAIGSEGNVFVGTTGGVSILKEETMTLAKKAAYYEKMIRARHVRPPGLVERCRLRVAGDVNSFEPEDTDNDGEYTGTYLVAEAYRYGATRSEEAKQNADDAFEAMEFLQSVTGTPGFVARTVVPATWTNGHDPNLSYSPQQRAEMLAQNPREKFVERRWRLSKDLKWLWKGDTSSDEITGHIYSYGVYYDVVADEEKKKRVANLVKRIVDGIIEGGYTLRDEDGQPTLWSVWSPEKLNHDPNWANERGINSVEILAYLTTAHAMTGNLKYDREIDRLLHQEGYAANIMSPRPTDVGGYTYIDDELIAMAYRGLITYERNPDRLALYRRSMDIWFASVRKDASPCYNFIYAALSGASSGEYLQQACVDLLQDVPLDMIHWSIDNSDRGDVQIVGRPQSEARQTDRMLPPSEVPVLKWDNNSYKAAGGDGGTVEMCPAFWLWGYWMGRYHGFLSEVVR